MEEKPIELLFIENSPEDIDLTLRTLKNCGFTISTKVIEDGQKAMDYLFENSSKDPFASSMPKLLLLDLKLPKVNGLEILKHLKQHNKLKEIPVVIFSSSDEQVDVKKAYELGANSYIVKPVDFEKFTESIQNLGTYWLTLNISS
ncbi:response regulator [Pseudozobellia sp. WGM2]|uniref:response regulator n=1 Tax=Pseudozobellia sp. WGM2 TaxID=2787625 RepID=UPI001AE08DBD|nr:response regulator [Pseudozobellia sp. WGM2]